MAEPVLKVDATGATGASLAENVDGLNERQREAFGADLAATPQTPQSQWSGIAGLGLTEMGEAGARAAVYGSSVDHAPGVHLDAIGSVADVRRLQATHSRLVATLTGVGGTVVPAGSRAKTDPGGDEFATTEAVTLSATGVTVTMQAVETGPVEAAAGTLTRIVTGIEGWETVTNAADAVLGRARQGDDEYRRLYRMRAAHSSVAPIDGLRAALTEAGATRSVVSDNPTNAAVTSQSWTLPAHSILAIVSGGLDGDIHRAVENHRGMGVTTLTAIVGGELPTGGIAALSSPYTLEWRGTSATVMDGDWTGAADNAARAAAITDVLTGVTVAWTGHRFIAQYEWMPDDETAGFDSGALATALGLDPDAAAESPGPFVRPTARALDVAFTLTRRTAFPSDGLERIRSSLLARVGGIDAIADRDLTDDARADIRTWLDGIGYGVGYAIGEEVWINDILGAAERIPGTRITSLTVQSDSAAVSGVAVSLDNLWTLDVGDISITVA